MSSVNQDLKIAYFGGEPMGVPILEILKKNGIVPNLIVCSEDKPVGRKHVLTSPPVKVWAEENNIEVFQPESFKNEIVGVGPLQSNVWDLFVVVAYNHILPKWLINLPKHKTLNVHPSLLPKLRGPSPIRTAILTDMKDEIGVSIIVLDEKMDHGPIVAQTQVTIDASIWPIRGQVLDVLLANAGGALLAETIPTWIAGEIDPTEQNHDAATFCKKMVKADGELSLDPYNLPSGEEAYAALLKIRAYDGFPGTYFMHKGKRVKITDAELSPEGQLRILTIIPEGKKEMDFIHYISD